MLKLFNYIDNELINDKSKKVIQSVIKLSH